MIYRSFFSIATVSLSLSLAAPSAAETTINVGVTAGGGYDFAARLMAPFLEKHLDDGSSVIVQNVPGASSLNLARQMQVSDSDDEIGLILASQIIQARLDPDHVAIDFSTFKWLGSLNSATSICITSKDSKADDFQSFISSDLKIGATSQTGGFYELAALVKNAFDAKYEIITGFKGLTDIEAAMQRGELDGYCGSQLDRYVRNGQAGTFNLIGSLVNDISLEGATIPSLASQTSNEADQAAMKLYAVRDQVYYPFFMAPGASDEAVARYREAFSAVLADEEFLAKASEFYIEINSMDGETLAGAIDAVTKADAGTVDHLKELLK